MSERIPLNEYPARRIALIKPSALGDIVHSLPVLHALRRRFPNAYIAWIVNKSYAGLLQGHPDLNEVVGFERGKLGLGLPRAIFGYAWLFSVLRSKKFDLAIDLQGLLRSGLITWATGAPRRAGMETGREGSPCFYTDRIRGADFQTMHAVDRYWLMAQALGAGDGPKVFQVPQSEANRNWAREMLDNCPRPWLAVGVGARWVTKRWLPEHFATLLRKVQERFGGTAIFIGSGEDTPLARHVARKLRGSICELTGKTTLPQLTAVLSLADVMLANDTGPLHLATALGRPVVAPYTCTKAALTGPYGAAGQVIEARVGCQGSYLKQCNRMECMDELTPYRVWPLLQATLRTWETSSLSA